MLVVWSIVLGVLFFVGLLVVTILFGAAANAHEKEAQLRTERERSDGLTGDVTSDTPHPIHQRYLEA
ncbi:hypothetical protein [Hyalangium versicolor]|uniref:hypothetical protein n=1 Tax=Hyalangium versicolor TaxID=2861190 RepID=UPI001CCDEF2E|nr:hypothetical protein [Hyalangium versicolor]